MSLDNDDSDDSDEEQRSRSARQKRELKFKKKQLRQVTDQVEQKGRASGSKKKPSLIKRLNTIREESLSNENHSFMSMSHRSVVMNDEIEINLESRDSGSSRNAGDAEERKNEDNLSVSSYQMSVCVSESNIGEAHHNMSEKYYQPWIKAPNANPLAQEPKTRPPPPERPLRPKKPLAEGREEVVRRESAPDKSGASQSKSESLAKG